MAQVSGGVQFRVYCLVSSYWVQSIRELQFAGFKLLGNSILLGIVFAPGLLGERTVLHQAIEELPFAGFCLVSRY